jgi:alanine dehydrogenase
MNIGVPKELKKLEFRVGLSPDYAKKYIDQGHRVFVQTEAGIGSGFSDQEYKNVGCTMVSSIEDVYRLGEMIIKVKEPLAPEFMLMRDGQILFTFLHLAASRELTQVMMDRKVIGIAYETIKDDQGRLPCLRPMSEVAGRLAIQEGARFLQKNAGGKGILLGGVKGVAPGHVVVIGADGYAGYNATEIALGMQANVTAISLTFNQLPTLKKQFGDQLVLKESNELTIQEALKTADLVVSAVLIPGAKAPKLIRRDHLKLMQPGSVIIDIAIDQGGSTETSILTYHDNPIYKVDDIIHYCVGNMPGAVPRTSTLALNQATLPYGLMIANGGYLTALKNNPGLLQGLNTYQGKVTCEPVATLFGLPYLPLKQVIQ